MKKRYSNFFEKLICMGAVILAVIPLLFVAGKSVQVPEEYLILLFKRPLYLPHTAFGNAGGNTRRFCSIFT